MDALLRRERLATVVGVYDGLSALMASQHAFDALWLSGLGISAALGLPDASIASSSDFLAAARTVCRSTDLPVVADADSGFGDVNTVLHVLAEYERAGVAAVCIEDKRFPKRNSFSPDDVHSLADPAQFAATISAAKSACNPRSPILIARLESLVVGAGVDDALKRAELYVRAGADALLVHSSASEADEVFQFSRSVDRGCIDVPLLVVPTSYAHVRHDALERAGFSAIVYANQIVRSFVAATQQMLSVLVRSDSPIVVEDRLASVSSLLSLIGSDAIAQQDRDHERRAAAHRVAASRRFESHPQGGGHEPPR